MAANNIQRPSELRVDQTLNIDVEGQVVPESLRNDYVLDNQRTQNSALSTQSTRRPRLSELSDIALSQNPELQEKLERFHERSQRVTDEAKTRRAALEKELSRSKESTSDSTLGDFAKGLS